MPKSLTRVSRTKKEHLSVDPSRGQFWKAGSEKARQKGAHVSARGDDRSRFSAHARTCAYARYGGSGTQAPPSSFPGISPTRWRRCVPLFLSFFFLTSGKTVGIRDMCVPIHTPRSWFARGRIGGENPCGVWKESPNAGGRRTIGGAKGERMRQGWEDDRTYAVHGRHKAANPWEYRACASGPARGLHELYGLSLFPPRFSLLPQTSGCSLHAWHSGPRTEISSTRGYVKRATSPASMLPPTARAGRVSVAWMQKEPYRWAKIFI